MITKEAVEAAREAGRQLAANQPGALVEAFGDIAVAGLTAAYAALPAGVVKVMEPTYTQAEYDEAYELGKCDGYSEAVQQIDQLTGGDGEYRYCSDHDPERHTPGPAEMIQRIVDRFETLNLIDDASKTGRDQEWGMSAIEPAGVVVETPPPSTHVGVDFNKLYSHPLAQGFYDLTQQIERLGTSPEMTSVIVAVQSVKSQVEAEINRLLQNAASDGALLTRYHRWCERNGCAPSTSDLYGDGPSPSPQPRAPVPAALKGDEQ